MQPPAQWSFTAQSRTPGARRARPSELEQAGATSGCLGEGGLERLLEDAADGELVGVAQAAGIQVPSALT